ncbi:MAG: hypothetical protein Q9219_005996 [cf. Caloplaca sp. 3 TL-2023]
MAEGLPEGLVTTNEAVKENIESFDIIGVEDIARLWKAYHTNRAVFAEDVGRRLDNFFWRIWGNKCLRENITGTFVAAIFTKISEGGYIRTTPTQSPRSSRSLGIYDRPQQPEEHSKPSYPGRYPSVLNPRSDSDVGDAEETETESSLTSRKKLPPRPPPILKRTKPTSPSGIARDLGSSIQSGRLSASDPRRETVSDRNLPIQQIEGYAHSERSTKATRFTADEVKPPVRSAPRAFEDEEPTEWHSKSKQKPAKRRVAVVATTATSKRRPAMRSRSSQSSSSNVSANPPSLPKIEPNAGDYTQEGSHAAGAKATEGLGESSISQRHSSDCDMAVLEGEKVSAQPDSEHDTEQDKSSALGSRLRSTARVGTNRTTLTSVLRKSTAAVAASASYQATGTMDFGQQSKSGMGPDPAADSPDNLAPLPKTTGNNQNLPRTKSQLTLLLQRNQKPSNDQ